MKPKTALGLILLTVGAFFVAGYHPGAEDAEIYLPGILKLLHPQLFPFNTQFFESHAHLTKFPNIVAASVRLTHLPLDYVLLFWQVAAIFLLLTAAFQLASICFPSATARWAAVAFLAALLTIPVTGTSLYIIDQYINPRNLAACTGVFAIANAVQKKYLIAAAWLVLAAVIHPLMAVFAFSYCLLLVVMDNFAFQIPLLGALLPFGINFDPPSPAYHQVAISHSYHYFLKWEWYEILGVIGPIVILWFFARTARSKGWNALNLMCRALIVYQVIYIAPAIVLSMPARFESLARLQPMRSVYLLYVLFILFAGGFLGEYVLKNRPWRWLALFVPLCGGMLYAQLQLFPASAHVEWPGAPPQNKWAEAFEWIRQNTPNEAYFALDPLHMKIPGEDNDGFRAIAQRSMLADAVKDSGAVTMFPPMAEEWLRQSQAQSNWKSFQLADFRRLHSEFGVDWLVLQRPGLDGFTCPYRNEAVLVCQIQ